MASTTRARGPIMTSTQPKSWLAAAAAPVRTESKNHHLLHRTHRFSVLQRKLEKRSEPYRDLIKSVGTVGTVEDFWAVYTHLARADTVKPPTDFYLFQEDIQPMWEDEANTNGGRLMIRITKKVSPKAWEDLLLAIIGEQFETEDICGVACSVRYRENNLSIWLRDAKDVELINRVKEMAKKLIAVPPKGIVHDWAFKPHHADRPTAS